MQHSRRRLDIAAWVLLAASCGSAPPRPAPIDELLGSWRLAGTTAIGARVPTLTIAASGAMTGNSGVNSFRSSVDPQALGQGRWQAGAMTGTEMAGTSQAMALEQHVRRGLQAANAALMLDGRLLLCRGSTVLLEFERVALR